MIKMEIKEKEGVGMKCRVRIRVFNKEDWTIEGLPNQEIIKMVKNGLMDEEMEYDSGWVEG